MYSYKDRFIHIQGQIVNKTATEIKDKKRQPWTHRQRDIQTKGQAGRHTIRARKEGIDKSKRKAPIR